VDATGEPLVLDRDLAVERLFREHRTQLLRLGFLLTDDRSLAEDLVQDAFLGLQRRWSGLVDRSAAAAYLRTSVVNGARSQLRRRIVARRHLRVAEPDEAPSADLAVLLTEEHREVVEAMRRLPRRQRAVLVLRYWSGLSEAEIAAVLGVARGTVKSSASRALATLETHLGGGRER